MNESTFIVTGGAGFIGSHLADQLLSFGKSVIVVDNLSSGFERNIPKHERLKFLNIDISNWNDLSSAYSYFQGAKGVFHLAAEARIQPSIQKPFLTNETNVRGTLNVLEMMKMLQIKNIIYSSSSSCYGPDAEMPCMPDAVPNCQTPYSVSKLMGELYCQTWGKLHGINNIILRYFNVYGKNSPLEGKHAPVVGLFINQVLNNKPLTIVGTGEQKRDFTHVSDVVSANLLAMKALMDRDTEQISGEVFNVGTGVNYSIMEVADMVIGIAKKITEREGFCKVLLPLRTGESKETLASIDKTSTTLGYRPRIGLYPGVCELLQQSIEATRSIDKPAT